MDYMRTPMDYMRIKAATLVLLGTPGDRPPANSWIGDRIDRLQQRTAMIEKTGKNCSRPNSRSNSSTRRFAKLFGIRTREIRGVRKADFVSHFLDRQIGLL